MSDTENTYEFQAEINQLMSLIINAFYSNKDIFLRELVSNASDALDKIRYQSLTDPSCLAGQEELGIWITADRENRLLTIHDTGIGMAKKDLISNLGTIARSGTRQFMEVLEKGGDISLIGQFGVGFYSAYLVADRVQVISKHNDDECYLWESSAGGTFTVKKHEDDSLKRGTKIILNMKEDCGEYLKEHKIKDLIKTHSQYIGYPIYLLVDREREVPKPEEKDEGSVKEEATTGEPKVDEATGDEPKGDTAADEPKVDEATGDEPKGDTAADEPKVDESPADEPKVEDEKEEKKPEMVKEKYTEFEHLNTQKPIWIREQKDVTDEEHKLFYKSISNDWESHLAVKHFKVEGQIEFTGLLYCPARAPFDMFQSEKKKNNLRLHVRRVFITDNCDELVPEWLSFLKGVVDSEDLPLNISREFFQQNKILKTMKKNIVKKALDLFEEIMNGDDKEKAKTFYEQFSKNVKLGIHEDSANRSRLLALLRYATTHDPGTPSSLEDYVTRMKENQTKIYYITGDSVDNLSKSPFIEQCRSKGFEVIYMIDPLDEYVMQQVKDFQEKSFVCLSKEGFELEGTEEEKKALKEELEEEKKKNERLCSFFKETLKDRIEKVDISSRLVDSPLCLVTNQFGWSANMERIMKAQALRDGSMSSYMMAKKTLEINPKHAIIRQLAQKLESGNESDKGSLRDLIELLFSNTLLQSGFTLEQPERFNSQILKLVALGLDIEEEEKTEETNSGAEPKAEEEAPVESQMESVD
jgi:molecular chaperone HtpG